MARAGTNICRREWNLRVDPATTTQVKRNSLLEERASICRRNFDSINCQIGKDMRDEEGITLSFLR